MPAKRPPALDRIDIKILASLQRDGRSTNEKLAAAVALSPRACLERVRRLEVETAFTEMVIEAKSTVLVNDIDPFGVGPNSNASALRVSQTMPLVWMPWQRQVLEPYLLPPELPETELSELVEYAQSFVRRHAILPWAMPIEGAPLPAAPPSQAIAATVVHSPHKQEHQSAGPARRPGAHCARSG